MLSAGSSNDNPILPPEDPPKPPEEGYVIDADSMAYTAPIDLIDPTEFDADILLARSGPLINLDQLRADARFAGVTGDGYAGSGPIAVAVVDTGIDTTHPYLNYAGGYDFYYNDPDPTDYVGHGTHVAGIVGSTHGNYQGVAPGANIYALKVFPDGGGGAYFSDIERALQWVQVNAASTNIVSVNMSLGAGHYRAGTVSGPLDDEIAALESAGICVASASGNSWYSYYSSGPGQGYPAVNSTLGVGSVWSADLGGPYSWSSGAIDYSTGADRLVSHSQRDPDNSNQVLAPGAIITSTVPGGGFANKSGTSMASPHVAGLVALVQDAALEFAGRFLTTAEVTDVIRSSAVTVYDGDDENDNVGNTHRNYLRIDAYAAIELVYDVYGDDDFDVMPFPTPLEAKAPLGSLIYDPAVSSTIGFVGDTDSFTLDVDPGQTIAVIVEADDASLQPTVDVYDPSATWLGGATAPVAGARAVLQPVATTGEGTYTITVGAWAGTTGAYTVEVLLNAAVDAEENDTIAQAQDIEASFISLAGRAERGAVVGRVGGAVVVGRDPVPDEEPNDTLGTAQNIDGEGWNLNYSPDIGDMSSNTSTTIPHVTIEGTGDGTYDWYSFTVENAGDRGIFDIDYGYGGAGAFDTYLRLYRSDGTWMEANDDNYPSYGQGGSTSGLDSYLEYTFPAPGVYVIKVSQYYDNPIPSGADYKLQVSLENHPIPTVGGDDPTDYFSFDLDAGEVVTLALTGVSGEGGGNEAVSPEILLMDADDTTTSRALDSLGVPYTLTTAADFASVDLSDYNVLFVGWNVGSAKVSALQARSAEIALWNSAGNGIVALSPFSPGEFDWAPLSNSIVTQHADDVYIIDATHPVNQGLTSALLSNWGNARHSYFTSWDPSVDVLTENGAGYPVTIAGEYGAGRVILSGQDPDFHYTYASEPGAATLLTNMIDWVTTTTVSGSLELRDASGALLEVGTEVGTNVDQVISNFVAPEAGTYYARVSSAAEADYTLVVTRNAVFDTESNDDFASAQDLEGLRVALGFVGAGISALELESFDDGTLTEYVMMSPNNALLTSAAAHDGPWGLEARNATEWMYRDDAEVHLEQGDVLSLWARTAGANDWSRGYFGFAATSTGCYSVVMAPNTGEFLIQRNDGYAYADIGAVAQSWTANHWYRILVDWRTDGTITAQLFDSDGTTLLNTVTAHDATRTEGGIAFRAFGSTKSFDTIELGNAHGETSDDDWYRLSVMAGEQIRVETETPADGPGEFVSLLDPRIELYDPSGALVVSGVAGADGRNESLTYTALADGEYRVRVTAEGATSGEYVLATDVSIVEPPEEPPQIEDVLVYWGAGRSASISDGLILPWSIHAVEMIFSKDVEVQVEDLNLVGQVLGTISPIGFSYDSASHTARWEFSPLAIDRFMLELDGDDATSDGNIGVRDWSGFYLEGGDYLLDFAVLPGDFNGDGVVNSLDYIAVRNEMPMYGGSSNPRADLDGDGDVDTYDLIIERSFLGTRLP